jgi:hypothetical protein
MIEKRWQRDSWQLQQRIGLRVPELRIEFFAGGLTRGPESGKLKNLHCEKPLPGNGRLRHSGLERA